MNKLNRALRWASLASGQETVPIATTPRTAIYERDRMVVYHYKQDRPTQKIPILLIYSLINRPSVLDLRPGRSVVQSLLEQGFEVYLLDWGVPTALDQFYDLDVYVNFLIRAAVREVCLHSEQPKISLLGYCMGGSLTAMYAALHPERVASIIFLGAPFYFRSNQLLYQWGTDPNMFDPQKVHEAFGNAPPWAFEGFSILQMDTKPAKYAGLYKNLDDPAFLESYLAMEQWVSDNIPMPGAVYAEFIKSCFHENKLFVDQLKIAGKTVRLQNIKCPVLILAGEKDHLVPPETTCKLVEKCPQAETIVFPSGHIGLSVSGGAQKKLWPMVGSWLALQHPCNEAAVVSSQTNEE